MEERIFLQLVEGPVHADWARTQVEGEDCGCSCVFYGTVREQGRLGEVTHLHYEAYPRMVKSELSAICREVLERFEVERVAVEHSIGTVPLGQSSVAVAIAARHRREVFAASAHLMDELKQRVPIWKKEHTRDGDVWIGQGS